MRPQKLLSGSIFALLNLYHCSNIHKRINQVLRMTDEDKEKNMQTVGNVSFRWLNQKDLGKNIKWINLKIIIPRGKKELSLTNPSEQCRKMRNGSHYKTISSAAPLWLLSTSVPCGVPPMGFSPSWTDPTWASDRPQLSKLFSNTASCHGAHPSGTVPAWVLTGSSSPRPSPPQDTPPPWAAVPARAAPEGALYGLCHLQAPSITDPCVPPRLHVEICSTQSCSLWAAEGQPVLPWAFPGLQEPVALHLEYLFLSFSTATVGCRAISPHFFTLPFQILLYNIFCPILSALIEVQGALLEALLWLGTGPFWSWIWLLSAIEQLWDSAHRGHLTSLLLPKPNTPKLSFNAMYKEI